MFSGLTTLMQTLRQLFRNSMKATSFVMMILVLHLLTPSYLLHNLAFLVLAGGLGLPLDVLLAGQVLRWLLGCLAAAEPLLLIGLLVWAGHKVTVRKLPLVDRQYWINRMGNLRVVINQYKCIFFHYDVCHVF